MAMRCVAWRNAAVSKGRSSLWRYAAELLEESEHTAEVYL
jgi:hypothetical protein